MASKLCCLTILVCSIVLEISARNIDRFSIRTLTENANNASSLIPTDFFSMENFADDSLGLMANLSKIHYYLHTNDNPIDPDELFVGDSEALEKSHFKKNGPLWILVHGFGAGIGGSFPYETGIDLLAVAPDANVILLDWSELAKSPDYIAAVRNCYAVSNHSAELLEFLVGENVITPENVHLIGFSLGGQVVGIIGKRFQWLTNVSVGRVSSLDPALPLFDVAEDDDRISSDDATFVDVTHTAAGTLGMVQPRGHVDFYPNGGSVQPGCKLDASCAHARAVWFFKESIHGVISFRSCKCESYKEYDSGNCACDVISNLGFKTNQSLTGKFYLRTNAEPPFARG